MEGERERMWFESTLCSFFFRLMLDACKLDVSRIRIT